MWKTKRDTSNSQGSECSDFSSDYSDIQSSDQSGSDSSDFEIKKNVGVIQRSILVEFHFILLVKTENIKI